MNKRHLLTHFDVNSMHAHTHTGTRTYHTHTHTHTHRDRDRGSFWHGTDDCDERPTGPNGATIQNNGRPMTETTASLAPCCNSSKCNPNGNLCSNNSDEHHDSHHNNNHMCRHSNTHPKQQ